MKLCTPQYFDMDAKLGAPDCRTTKSSSSSSSEDRRRQTFFRVADFKGGSAVLMTPLFLILCITCSIKVSGDGEEIFQVA